MTTRTKVWLNVVAILITMGMASYSHYAINELAAIFTEVRVADAKFFSKLIRENWEGIKTIPDEKKKVLLQNIDPALTGSDIQIMRFLMLVFMYGMFALVVLNPVTAISKLWKASRHKNAAT